MGNRDLFNEEIRAIEEGSADFSILCPFSFSDPVTYPDPQPINFYIPIAQVKYRKLYYKSLYPVIAWTS